jgi:ketosteroid isomerase-like protein
MKRITFLASVIFCLASCNNKAEEPMVKDETKTAEFDISAAKTAIENSNTEFENSFRKGDTMALTGHYTKDAVIYPPEMEPITTAEVPGCFGTFMRWGTADINLNTTSVTGDEDHLLELGTWEIFSADKKKIDNGKFMAVWMKENGAWKISHDIWNTNNPIPRATK